MNCPTPERLVDYFSHELTTAETVEIREHLVGCPDCRAEIYLSETLERALAESLRAPAAPTTPLGKCLDAPTLAAYLDRGLAMAQKAAAEQHLLRCRDCLDELMAASARMADLEAAATPISAELLKRAIALDPVAASKRPLAEARKVIDLVVNLLRDSVELISTSGQLQLSPVPVSVRGESQTGANNILRIEDALGDLQIAVVVEAVKVGRCQVTVDVARQDEGALSATRISLLRADRAVAAYPVRQGQAVFEDVPPGDYQLVIAQAGETVGSVNLKIDGDL
jgi:hypothetical protein